MTPIELICAQLDWANKNICHNLDFLPEDKLNWKPQPSAKSPLEIVHHMTDTINMMTSGITGEKKILTPATNATEAKRLVDQAISHHQNVIKALTPEQLEQTATLPIGEFSMIAAAALPVTESINHHGQFTYIQTLLGDDESHLLLD